MTYNHTCKNCKKIFWGRKNKVFHDITCKANYHNERAAKFRKELLDNPVMEKAYISLKILHRTYPDSEPFSFEVLILFDIDESIPVRLFLTPLNGFEYRIIHGYGYRFTDETKKYVIVNSKEEIDKL